MLSKNASLCRVLSGREERRLAPPRKSGTQEWRDYQKAWYAANREKVIAQRRVWREANRDKARASVKKYQEANRALLKEKRKKNREKNIENERARERAWYHNHREQVLASTKAWQAKNPEKVKATRAANVENQKVSAKAWRTADPARYRRQSRKSASKRRALERGATIGDIEAIAIWEARWRNLKRVTCHWCSKKFPPKKCNADHVMPLARGGAHSLENLVVSCASCNARKWAKLPHEWSAHLVAPPLL